jgi:Domain of unknown function (DUF6898)
MAEVRTTGGREILIEIVTLGAYAKASAIDTATGKEVSVTGPATASRASLEAAAIRKLEFVLRRNAKS